MQQNHYKRLLSAIGSREYEQCLGKWRQAAIERNKLEKGVV